MKKGSRLFALLLAVLTLASLVACSEEEEAAMGSGDFAPTEEVTNYVCIQMDTGKKIILELYPDVAPITVENFQKLVADGFYDGLTFHRIISGFMIQGGCPEGTGFGGPGWTIKGEFAANGVKNDLKHTRGVLSMARSNDPDSAGSQFFIMHDAAPHLDGKYAAFGKVVSGLEVVDEIAKTAVDTDGQTPLVPPVMEKVYFVKPTGKVQKAEKKTEETKVDTPEADGFTAESGKKYAVSEEKTNLVCIRMENGKRMVVELYPDVAPITVENFQKLVADGFYDGSTFHRIISGFMIQGGASTGAVAEEIKGEFSANGVENNLSHERGVLSMARKNGDPDSATSQFFICHSTEGCQHLNGNYAAFGRVIEGMDVVDEIAGVTVNASDTPLERQGMEMVYFVTEMNIAATENN